MIHSRVHKHACYNLHDNGDPACCDLHDNGDPAYHAAGTKDDVSTASLTEFKGASCAVKE